MLYGIRHACKTEPKLIRSINSTEAAPTGVMISPTTIGFITMTECKIKKNKQT